MSLVIQAFGCLDFLTLQGVQKSYFFSVFFQLSMAIERAGFLRFCRYQKLTTTAFSLDAHIFIVLLRTGQ
ncbi:hypothetical protein [Pseudomonas viridiflava]|uniref:hypothetical protein n=1 Tax=Pseudomonas viridiflava TaxID=33069 RepID=UPI0013DF8D00|nr:hypothetical protein [Pseudomonas viridiflava]WKW32074.1 hypothetical protein KIH13_26665 [Pseudomonas viridiflava]